MSKIEVIGPKDRLLPVLATIRRSETMQIDASIPRRIEGAAESRLAALAAHGAQLDERILYEELVVKIGRLLALMPDVPSRASDLSPRSALAPISRGIDKRLAWCEQQQRRRTELQQELTQITASLTFLTAAAALVPDGTDGGGLDVIAVALKDHVALERLTDAARHLPLVTGLRSTRAADGSYIGLLTTEKSLADRLRQSLTDDQIPEVSLPAYVRGRPLAEKIALLRARAAELTESLATLDRQQQRFAQTWRQLHAALREWLRSELAILDASALAFETANCFVLFGWTPTVSVKTLQRDLARDFGQSVIVEEKPILLSDLEQVPVALRNPRYLRPFELLVTLMPPPRYTSFDPTPLVALSFPVFFGLMVGDVGHGVVLLGAAVAVIASSRTAVLQQAAWVLTAAAIFTIVFGVVFGECFGEAGAHLLGLEPLVDRRTSFVPMLLAAVGVGFVHISLGLVLGVFAALAARHRREALFRATSLAMIVGLAGLAVTFVMPAVAGSRRPLAVALALAVPLLLISGGLVAPFEIVRHVGNIVSYARLMAIGLASVLLAHVANGLATAIENIWLAIALAIALHAFNIVLGVFGPTIHALRLHYVEFFSKFFEPAIKRYEPLKAP